MTGKSISALCVLITIVMLFTTLAQAGDKKIIPVLISEQIYMIAGKGGNIGLFIGKDGRESGDSIPISS